jgi:hypothetical protein
MALNWAVISWYQLDSAAGVVVDALVDVVAVLVPVVLPHPLRIPLKTKTNTMPDNINFLADMMLPSCI